MLLRQNGAEPQSVLYGPVTQPAHHNSLGQAGLSSICHLEKHHCVKGEGCDRELPPPPPPPTTHPPSPAASVGSAPLPPLPEQQEKLGRISGSKLDPGPEDEETLVTSLPTSRGPKITFLSEKPSGTPSGRARRQGAKYCTQTRLS